jgi:hypothetical protein
MGTFGGAQPIVTDGLVFAVDAANYQSYPGSGTTWTDLAGSNNGTLTNGPTFDSGNGGSIVFDDTDDIVVHGSSNNLTGDNLQTCTLSAWFKTTTTSVGYITSIKRQSTNSTLCTLHVNATSAGSTNSGYAGFMTRNNANNSHTSVVDNNSGDGWNDGEWHHLLGVVNGTTRTLYIDGEQKDTDTEGMQNVTGNTAPFTIGGFATSGFTDQFFGGNIANVSFYRRALSSTEVLQNYNALKSRFGL